MTDFKPNQLARIVAVVALMAAFVLVGLVLLNSGDDSSEQAGKDGTAPRRKLSKQVQRDLERGFYVVEPGDTLVGIARKTRIDEDELEELNPELDPQLLISGQRIKLR